MIMVGMLENLTTGEKGSLVAAINELVYRMQKERTVDYYGSISAAISDINNGVTTNALADREGAKTAVFTAHTGGKTVMLLDNVSESAALTVNKDIDFALNGKALTLTDTAAVLTFGVGTKCRINGEVDGSAIIKEVADAAATVNLIVANGDLKIEGGRYALTGGNTKTNLTIKANASCEKLEIRGGVIVAGAVGTGSTARCLQTQAKKSVLNHCVLTAKGDAGSGIFGMGEIVVGNTTVQAEGTKGNTSGVNLPSAADVTIENTEIRVKASEATCYAINTVAGVELRIKDSVIFADAPDCHASTPNSVAIVNLGNLYADNVTAFGTHSAVTNQKNAYINGGTYTGYCHGGVYCAGSTSGETFINDAVLECGNYEGDFDYSDMADSIYGAFYIGGSEGSNNLIAYVDGCAFDGAGAHAIVLRGSSGEQNNTVYISNSTTVGGVRIDNDTLKLYVGVGTNITAVKIDNPSRAEFTGKLYRRNNGKKVLNGSDYAALSARMQDTSGLVKTVGGVAADKNGNVPLEWVAVKTFQPGALLPETSVSGGFFSDLTYEALEGQEELAILCDERLYLCVPEFGYSEGDGYYVYLGNKSLLSSEQTDTGEPFLIWGYKGPRLILSFKEGGTHTMSISGYVYVYNELPAQYLPVEAIREIVTEVLAETKTS